MPIDPRIALGVQPLQVQYRDPIASYNQLAQLQSNDTQNQLAQMQMQESRQLAPLRMQQAQTQAASAQLTYDQAKQAQDFVTSVMSKAAEHPEAPQDPMDAAMQMLQHPNPQVQAVGGHLLDASQKLMAYRQQAQFMKDEGGFAVAPTLAGAPAAVASDSVNNVAAPMVASGTPAPNVDLGLSRFVAGTKDLPDGRVGPYFSIGGQPVSEEQYLRGKEAIMLPQPVNALAPAVAAAPAVNAMIPAVASALQNADALKKEIEKGDRTYGQAPGWKSKRELLVKAFEQALKPTKTDSNFAAINPSEYTPESVAAFAVSGKYGDLIAKTGKADKLIGNVNPSDYTPASLAVFALSGKYEDLVLKPAKAEKPESLIANVNPNDYTLASLKVFAISKDYGDLVKVSKTEKADKLIGNVNPSDYTPASLAVFASSGKYEDLVLKPAKAEKADQPAKLIGNVNPDSYTLASVAAFALSGNYADLVLRPEKAKDSKNIANVNPNDFTPASIEKFVASGKYSDLVPVKKASEGGAAGKGKPPSGYRYDASGENLEVIPGGPADKQEKLKPIPANINTAISTNDMSIKRLQEALDLIKKNPDAIGLKNLLPGQALDRMDPKGVAARSAIGDIGSLVIHDRSGAAVSASEMQRLNFIPTPTDRADNAKTKLEAMLKYAKLNQQGLAETYAEDQGYKPNPTLSSKSKAAPATVSNW
jgi:hypothetical protein